MLALVPVSIQFVHGIFNNNTKLALSYQLAIIYSMVDSYKILQKDNEICSKRIHSPNNTLNFNRLPVNRIIIVLTWSPDSRLLLKFWSQKRKRFFVLYTLHNNRQMTRFIVALNSYKLHNLNSPPKVYCETTKVYSIIVNGQVKWTF